MMMRGLEAGFLLDRRWHALRGEMESTKRPTLTALARVLADTRTPYAVIGGTALQVHQAEPRTTLDIDVAVLHLEELPRAELLAAELTPGGQFFYSENRLAENWLGPDGVPVQFTDDPALAAAVRRAVAIDLGGVPLRAIGRSDLLHEKLRAGSDPARRRLKRLQDLADAEALLDDAPRLLTELTEAERAIVDSLPQ